MARFTRDEMLQKLKDLSAKETVFKVEVDDMKYHLSSVYDRAKYAVAEEFTHAGKWEKLTRVETEMDVPYSLVHLFGKKFLKSLNDAIAKVGRTPYLDAIGHLVSEMSPLNTLMQALVARQVKGRRPVETNKTVIGTRIQLRAVCPCCFRDHSVDGGRMVSHGYTLDYGYQNGICYGYKMPHFGTVEGRNVTARQAELTREHADMVERNANAIEQDPTGVDIRDSIGYVIKDPSPRQIHLHIDRMRYGVAERRRYAAMLEKMVADWQPKSPREVVVEITE